jgi:hypothetical protein
MKNIRLRYIFSLVLLVAVGLSLSAQNEKADARFLSLKKVYKLNKDGSWDYTYSHKLEFLSHYAFHRLHGETFVVYNPEYQTLKVKKSETTMADGTKVKSPDNAFNEVLPSFAANSPAYNHLTEMVITHTGLEVGSIVDLEYTIHTEAGFHPSFMGEELFASYAPIDDITVEVHIPKDVELNYGFKNSGMDPVIKEKGKKKIYIWNMKNQDMIPHEILTGVGNPQIPRLLFGAGSLHDAFQTFSEQEASVSKNEDLKVDFIDVLKKENESELDLILAIQKKVVSEMNNYPIHGKYIGFKARTAAETYASHGGTDLEKAILLRALYQKAGFSVDLVAYFPRSYYMKSVGNLLHMNHYAVRVHSKEHGNIILSPDHIYNRGMEKVHFSQVFLDINPERRETRRMENRHEYDVIKFNSDITWNTQDSIVMDGSFYHEGQYLPYFDYVRNAEKAKSEIKAINPAAIQSFEVKSLKIEEIEVDYEIAGNNICYPIEGYKVLNLPKLHDKVKDWRLPMLESDRQYRVYIPGFVDQSYSYTIVIPEGKQLLTKEYNLETKNRFGKVKMSLTKVGDNTYKVENQFKVTDIRVKPIDIPEFMKLAQPWLNERHWQIIIK